MKNDYKNEKPYIRTNIPDWLLNTFCVFALIGFAGILGILGYIIYISIKLFQAV